MTSALELPQPVMLPGKIVKKSAESTYLSALSSYALNAEITLLKRYKSTEHH